MEDCTPKDRGTRWWCCAQVDSALLSHPLVTEAVSFGAPDEKYGETVAAAVVLSQPADDAEATVADIKKAAAAKLAKFKVRACYHHRRALCLWRISLTGPPQQEHALCSGSPWQIAESPPCELHCLEVELELQLHECEDQCEVQHQL